MQEDNRLIDVRCIGCGKVTGHLMNKFDRMVDEGAFKVEQINNLRGELVGDNLLDALIEGGYTNVDDVNSLRKRYLRYLDFDSSPQEVSSAYDSIVNAITDKHKITGVLDQLHLTRYCCRKTLLTPAILPMGSGLMVGESIQSLEQQIAYNVRHPIRTMSAATPVGSSRMSGLPSQALNRLRPIGSGSISSSSTPRVRSIMPKSRFR